MKRRILFAIIALCTAFAAHAGTVNLNFFVGSDKILTYGATEGSTYTLSDIISGASIDMTSYQCRDYVFQGWKVGHPVEGTETPTMPTTVTPTDNMNLYAVFKHTNDDKVNKFVRITTTDNLQANSEYLVICYYVYGGEQQYYALTNDKGTYFYETTCRNRLDASQVHPHNGVIIPSAGEEGIIWTLRGTPGAWKWYNENADNWLRIGGTDEEMLVSAEGSASSCAITQANGIFTIRNTANNKILKYVDDYITEEDDYFITGDYTDYVIYLYKRESAFTSYPDCDPWTVHLDALDGKIKDQSYSQTSLTEDNPGDKVTLPEAEVTGLACDGWTFVGWSLDAPIHGSTTAPEHVIPAGEYDPLYNGVTLYAIYSKTETVTKYTRVTSGSAPTDGTYLIVAKNGTEYYAMGNTEALSSNYGNNKNKYYASPSISVEVNASGEIIGDQADAIEWTYASSQLRNVGNTSVYINPTRTGNGTNPNPYIYDILGSAANLYLERSGEKWGIYGQGDYYCNVSYNSTYNEFVQTYSSSLYAHFYLYKKTTVTTTSYTAYPHCTPYTVYLHACGGNIEGEANVTMKQATATSPVHLPVATPACPAEGWEFVGWFRGEDKESFEHVEFTDFVPGNSDFIPDHDETHLYAIYRRITDRFRIIDGVSDIANGDTYIVTFYNK